MQDSIEERLRKAGLRPTRQRMALARLLFTGCDRHVAVEDLHREASAAGQRMALATVYNTLNQFRAAGLVREVAIEGDRSYFDTNTSNHFHYFDPGSGALWDMDHDGVAVTGLPQEPQGYVMDGLDVIVRLKPAKG